MLNELRFERDIRIYTPLIFIITNCFLNNNTNYLFQN